MKSFLTAAVVLTLASCASPIERRVEKNPQIFQSLSLLQRQDVQRGIVREGMSKGAVFIAWGRPARVQTGRKEGQPLERWSYNDYEPVYQNSLGFGMAFGHGCHGSFNEPLYYELPHIRYFPVEGRAVEFKNERVIGYTTR